MTAARILVLLGKPDCHLCHEMRDTIAPVLSALGFELAERDVRSDPALARRYILNIPVLLSGEEEVARHRIDADGLRRRLREMGLL